MVDILHILALVCFLMLRTHSQLQPWEMYSLLVYAHEQACIPEVSECYRAYGPPRTFPPFPKPTDPPPRETNHSLPPDNSLRLPRDLTNPLTMKRSPGICCGFCTCDSDCREHGSCCLSWYESLAHGRILTKNRRYSCVKPESLLGPRSKIVKPVWMITKCDPSYENRTVTEWCTNPGADGKFDSLIPLGSPGTTYRNRFCAMCNNIEDLSSLSRWDLEITCGTILQLPDKNLLQSIKERQCNIIFTPPRDTDVSTCKIVSYSISKCNVTGKWEIYDQVLEDGCNSFVDPFNQTYANVFCYLCNTPVADQLESSMCVLPEVDNLDSISPPFSAILDLGVINSMVMEDTLYCNKYTQFRDEKLMKCRDLMCAPDRERLNRICLRSSTLNNKCASVVVKMTYIGENADTLSDFVDDIKFMESLTTLPGDMIGGLNDRISGINVFIKRRSTLSVALVEYLVVQIVVVQSVKGHDILGNMVYALQKQTLSLYYFDIPFHFDTEIVAYNITMSRTELTVEIPGKDSKPADILKVSYSKQIDNGKNSICALQEVHSPMKKTDLCLYLKTSLEEIPIRLENGIMYGPGNLTLTQWEYDIIGKDVLICFDDFLVLYEHLQVSPAVTNQFNVGKSIHPKQILAFACVCLSIVCLLVTIAIYIKFTELHSQPGVNNTILCISLLLAQVFYQFGAGQSSLSTWACALIGGICHFLWLSMVLCMNVCCIHMFRIFKSPVSRQVNFDRRLTFKYLLYITGLSLSLVLVNLGVSLGTSDGVTSGYGGNLCYISSPMMHLYTFVIPSAVTLAVNFVLFACVVIKISETSTTTRELHKERNYFGAYVRLSSLTGLTWIFGYLFIILKKETLEYLFIICNASQGFFIMVAFIFNKRIFDLIRRSTGLDKTASTNDNAGKNNDIVKL